MQRKFDRHILNVKKWFIGVPREGDVRGKRSETIFETMARSIINSRRFPWARGLSKASISEDILKSIDFRLRVTTKDTDSSLLEFSIPIQIKSSNHDGVKDFSNENGEKVYIIIMYPDLNLKQLEDVMSDIYFKETQRRKSTKRPA